MNWPALMLSAVLLATPVAAQQMGDPSFRPVVASPAYSGEGPMIQLDAAHGSVQTLEGRYAGFAALVRADGYRIRAGEQPLDAAGALDGVDVLVISNAVRPAREGDPSAFTDSEIEALDRWVRGGGSLLLAVDHAPYGSANETLGRVLGIGMGKGYAFRLEDGQATSQLRFSTEAGTLGRHPILNGRNPDETIRRVLSFTGQSLTGPAQATVLMALEPTDHEAADAPTLREINRRLRGGEAPETVLAEEARPALQAQGLAFDHGRGRVVVLGEAGMLTAQIIRSGDPSREDFAFGLQTSGHDDQQFALNVLHWLSRLEGLE
ncbi:MAG: DUF4350 domain-containing protein [Brevundimonas sp.]|nr:DUF4350 domain-containing protein [Brevundimonas sp.]